ncbi:unnamed protein product, partial [Musa hybrid cultivar]
SNVGSNVDILVATKREEQGRKTRERKGRRQGQRRETVLNHLAVFSSQVRSNLQ